MIHVAINTKVFTPTDKEPGLHVAPGDEHREQRSFGTIEQTVAWLENEGITNPFVFGPDAWIAFTSEVRLNDRGRPTTVTVSPDRFLTDLDAWTRVCTLLINVPDTPAPDPATVPDIGDLFSHYGHGYRVTGWLKRANRTLLSRDLGPDRCPLMWCVREEAQYVSGKGVAEMIVRVGDLRVTGRVDWDAETLDDERARFQLLVGERVQ